MVPLHPALPGTPRAGIKAAGAAGGWLGIQELPGPAPKAFQLEITLHYWPLRVRMSGFGGEGVKHLRGT